MGVTELYIQRLKSLVLANITKEIPTNIPTPAVGMVNLFVDANDGYLKLKDENDAIVPLLDLTGKADTDLGNIVGIAANLIPDGDNTRTLGDGSFRWASVDAVQVNTPKVQLPSSNIAVDLQNTLLKDSADVAALNWGSRQLYDSAGGLMIDHSGAAIDVNNKQISNLADPTLAQDAATKAYVDAQAAAESWIKVTKSYTDFSTAALTNTVTAFSTNSLEVVTGIILKHTTAFSGGGSTSAEVKIETAPEGDVTSVFDVFSAVDGNNFQATQAIATSWNGKSFDIRLTSDVNLDQLTAGVIEIYYKKETLPA